MLVHAAGNCTLSFNSNHVIMASFVCSKWISLLFSFEDGNADFYCIMAIPLWSASSDLPSQDEREKSLSASKARIHDLHAKVTTVGAQPPVQRHKQMQRWSQCYRMTIQETDMPNFCQLSKRQTVQQCSTEQTGGKEKIKHPRGEAYHGTVFLYATISHCHAECCQPLSSFVPQNKSFFSFFFLFFGLFAFLVWV